jgi:hypothetical protein
VVSGVKAGSAGAVAGRRCAAALIRGRRGSPAHSRGASPGLERGSLPGVSGEAASLLSRAAQRPPRSRGLRPCAAGQLPGDRGHHAAGQVPAGGVVLLDPGRDPGGPAS